MRLFFIRASLRLNKGVFNAVVLQDGYKMVTCEVCAFNAVVLRNGYK
jgi:hypothetical protein